MSENFILIREFKYNSIKLKDKIKISKFIPHDLKNLIDLNVPAGNYILGVSYRTGESQICISGHPKENENMDQGACRELCEELSLCLKKDCHLPLSYKDKINHFYFLDIKNTDIFHKNNINNYKDIKERAVICVYGDLKNILDYFTKIKYNLNNEDDIESIWSTSKENIMNYLDNKKPFLYNY